jgi:hypothetical protein
VSIACPVCESGESSFHRKIDGYDYFRCDACGSLHIDNATLGAIDGGSSTRVYDAGYWQDELHAARARAQGVSLVRAGEAILYARRPVRRFLDVGTGPGYLPDALAALLPSHAAAFHGVELFPPEAHSQSANYHIGDVRDVEGIFDAGTCIEVAEHLTPRMLRTLAQGLATISAKDSLWLFNTGSPDYVLQEDPGYLDPLRRGHIVAYGLRGVRHIFAPFGFRISAIPGKSYAWFAEFSPTEAPEFAERVYRPLPSNRALLEDPGLLFLAAFESARASLYQQIPAVGNDVHVSVDVWNEYQRMLQSRSWRMTRPLRGAARWLRRVRAKLAQGLSRGR